MPFEIVRNDITKMQVDAIVNTANSLPIYSDGTDSAVYEAAGVEKLLAENKKGFLCFAVFLNALTNYYFFVAEVVFVII